MLNKKLKGFTLIELLVTMALTCGLVVFAYMGFNNIQILLKQYSEQSRFIVEFNELNKRTELLCRNKGIILKEGEETILFKTDSSSASLLIKDEALLMLRNNQTDTFHLKIADVKLSFEQMNSDVWQNKLINCLEFDVLFKNQKFHFMQQNEYDAATKLTLEEENKNGFN